ncbi:MAG: hypothetical protein QE285_19160 [Aquabacterium sp.]|nr:hypothetical protein [Aquabacterium sp.]
MLRIDDKARSSMADGLARNRPTEIDAIQGEVLRPLCGWLRKFLTL